MAFPPQNFGSLWNSLSEGGLTNAIPFPSLDSTLSAYLIFAKISR